nr:hypothetical protein [Pyrinomonadaceae bacterium]
KKETAADFDNICQNEDQAQITIKGFLRKPNSDSNELLLFENANGTGGFIQIQPNDAGIFSNALPLTISGEILKKDNSCVLQIKKIEGF